MKRPKILQVCAIDFTVKTLLLPIINKLIDEGYIVDIACTPGKYSAELEKLGYSFKYVKIERKLNFFSNIKTILKLYKIIKTNNYDIVHLHTPSASILGRIAAKLAKTPIIIYTSHGFYFHENMKKISYYFFLILEKILCKFFTDFVFIQSEEDYTMSKKLKIIDNDKMLLIRNGIDIEKFNPNNVTIDIFEYKKNLGINPENIVITFVGRLIKEKGILDLIKVFKDISQIKENISLIFVGDIENEERDIETKKRLIDMINNFNLKEKCLLLGFRNDIPQILRISDIFVLPSYREGLPRSIIEAMSMKIPVVCYNIRGCREEVVHNQNGFLVPVGDLEKLKDCILKLIYDKNLREQMGDLGRKRVEMFYNETEVLRKQIDIIKRLYHEHCKKDLLFMQ